MSVNMTDLFTVEQFAERQPAWSASALRNLILNSADRLNSRKERIPGNGLAEAGAIVRVGRRVLIDECCFLAWVRGATKQKGSGIQAVLRFAVLKRDRFSCILCGATAARGAVLHVDHRVAQVLGGETSLENLQTLCERCNLGKGTQRI